MKRRHIGISLGILVAQASTITALAQDKKISEKDLTCQVYGGSFVLDDTDFKALADASSGITREKFAVLEPNRRASVCDTRKLWRLVKVGKVDACDLLVHYMQYSVLYLDDSETDALAKAQGKLTADLLAGTAKKCPQNSN